MNVLVEIFAAIGACAVIILMVIGIVAIINRFDN